MKLRIKINMDNEALEYGDDIPRILKKLASTLEQGFAVGTELKLRDINGNSVGIAIVSEY